MKGMREIKFRAWDGQQMHYNVIVVDGIGYKHRSIGIIYAHGARVGIPMQFTGLYDRKGTPIYEGDLLQHSNGTIAEIKYSDDLAAFVAVYVQNGNTEMDYLNKEIVNKCIIVGNIYENPELLEGEE